jgi:DNA primase catalytic core
VLDARVDDLVAKLTAARPHDPDTPAPSDGPLPWLPGIPARLAEAHDWGPFATAYHQLVREQIDAVGEQARGWTGATALAWAQPFLEDEDADLRANLAVWRAVAGTDENDLRPTGDRTIGAPGAYQAKLNRAVRAARPSYPFSQRTWYQVLPETVRADPWITPLCQRLARLERAGLPVTDYIKQALSTDPYLPGAQSGTDEAASPRPLPDEQQAAALWWRLVPHLGPAALGADEHSANLLQPTWRTALAELVGTTKADYLQKAPAWPALVAAVDEACEHHGWSPNEILSSALAGVPQDGSLTGVEVADALVLRIAMLTDQPTEAPPPRDDEAPYPEVDVPADPDRLPREDADKFMAAFYRDQPDDDNAHVFHSPTPAEYDDLAAAPVDREPPPDEHDPTSYDDVAVGDYPYVEDPYPTPLPWAQADEVTAENAFPDPNELPAERIHELNQQALVYFESCYPRSWAPGYLRERMGTDLADQPNYAVGYAPGGGRSLLRHLTDQGATLDELAQAGLVSRRERDDGTTYYDFFRDRLVLPIRDPHDPTGEAILGFVGRRNPTKTDDDFAGPKYLNTRNTSIFTKGEALFGYAEARELLANGALPVIVEGPMDALAITLGSNSAAVGLAPMGTALTVNQIRLLRANIDMVNGRDRIAVATDSDPAGWKSAQKAFWHLTAADLDPTQLELPDGLDPANLFETQGADAITAAVENRSPLGDAMIDNLLRTAGHWSETDVRQKLIHQAARVLGSRGPERWLDGFERLRHKLHPAPGILEHQTVTESMERDRNRLTYAQARIDEINAEERRKTAKADPQSRRRAAEQRLAATTTTPPPGLVVPATGPDNAGPAR